MPLKVLVVGLYRDSSGYSRAAAESILALNEAGADVYARPICFGDTPKIPLYPELRQFELKSAKSYDVVLAVAPPYCFSQVAGVKNVGMFYVETHPLPGNWIKTASFMDQIIMPGPTTKQWILDSEWLPNDIDSKIDTCPLSCDISVFDKDYSGTFAKLKGYKEGGRFLFYTVGEMAKRKNLAGLIRAFFCEFNHYENVGLVIKASLFGAKRERIVTEINGMCDEISKRTKIGCTPPVYIVPDFLSETELFDLQQNCDCFVQPSFGEGFSIPSLYAMGFGKTPIVTANAGYDHINEGNGYLIDSRPEPVFGEGEIHAELFTGKQRWMSPDTLDLQRKMRQAFNGEAKEKAAKGREDVRAYSRKEIGGRLLALLNKN